MFNRIWAGIMTVLMFLFPFFFKPDTNPPTLDVNAAVASVIAAIQSRDIAAIESYMCKNIKDNVPNLREEIGKLIDAIEGTITSTSSDSEKTFYASSGGKKIEQAISWSEINTSAAESYRVHITWEIYNNFSVEERGIRYIGLTKTTAGASDLLTNIMATEGIENWH